MTQDQLTQQEKTKTYNLINSHLASATASNKTILELYSKYLRLDGHIQDFEKHRPSLQKMIDDHNKPDPMQTERNAVKKWIQLDNRAKDKGLDFNLTVSDIKLLLSKKLCQYSGEEMIRLPPAEGGPITKNHLTIDRIDHRKGYVKGNVVACCHKWNQLKSFLFEATGIDSKSKFKYDEAVDINKFLSGMMSKQEK